MDKRIYVCGARGTGPPSSPTPMGWVPQAGLGNLIEMGACKQF